MSLVSAAWLLALVQESAGQSFDLCDDADRQNFYAATQHSVVDGAVQGAAGPGETVTITGQGFQAVAEQDLVVRLWGSRPGTGEASEEEDAWSGEACNDGPYVQRSAAARVLSDRELEFQVPGDMVWGRVKSVEGLFNVTQMLVTYQTPGCGRTEDLAGGLVLGVNYRPEAPVDLDAYVRSSSEFDLYWNFGGDESAIDGFRVYEHFCAPGTRVCVIPNPANYKDAAWFTELTNPSRGVILAPEQREEPVQYANGTQGGTGFFVMSAWSKACGESPPSRALRVDLINPNNGGVPNNERQIGSAEISIGYYENERDLENQPILSPFPSPDLETGRREMLASAVAYYDSNGNAELDRLPGSPDRAFPLYHEPTMSGEVQLNYSSGYAAYGTRGQAANVIVYATTAFGGVNYQVTAHILATGNGVIGVSLLAGENAALSPYRILMISETGTPPVNLSRFTLPANGQAGHIAGTISGKVVWLEPQRPDPFGYDPNAPTLRTWQNDITLSFDAPVYADN